MIVSRLQVHPGEILLEEFMKPMQLSSRALAKALKVPDNRISGIVSGKRGITADTALRLGRYFGTSAQVWLNMQTGYDTSRALAEKEVEINEISPRGLAA